MSRENGDKRGNYESSWDTPFVSSLTVGTKYVFPSLQGFPITLKEVLMGRVVTSRPCF